MTREQGQDQAVRGSRPALSLRRRTRALGWAVGVVLALLATAACSGVRELPADPAVDLEAGAITQIQSEWSHLIEGSEAKDPAHVAVLASAFYFASAGIVVLSPPDPAHQLSAASLAIALGVPVLVTGTASDPEVVAELERLDTHTVLVMGDALVPELSEDRPYLRAVEAPDSIEGLQVVINKEIAESIPVPPGTQVLALAALQPPFEELLVLGTDSGSSASSDATATESSSPDSGLSELAGLPPYQPTVRVSGAVVLTDGDLAQVAAIGTARAAGASVVVVPQTGLNATPATITQFSALQPTSVLGLGSVGEPDTFGYWSAVAATGVQVPGGGQEILPEKLYIGLRGTPNAPELGGLGQQDVPATMNRLAALASQYQSSGQTTIPSAQLLTTIASTSAGNSGDYSSASTVASLFPFVQAATESGVSVQLSFQPGRATFLSQVQQYEELLDFPNVGVTLEPTWRVGPGELPGSQAGSVSASEINEVEVWLTQFVRERSLPPKFLVVQAPNTSSVREPELLSSSGPQVEVVIEVDGVSAVSFDPALPVDPLAPPVVSAATVWESATASGWGTSWAWLQPATAIAPAELLGLDPTPVMITYR